MGLEVGAMAFVGMVVGALAAGLFGHVAAGLPVEHRYPLNLWTFGLVLQVLSWAALALHAAWPSPWLHAFAALCMLGSYAELVRAVRAFRLMPERRHAWWAIVAVALVGGVVLAGRDVGARILVNSLAGIVLLLATAWALGAPGVEPSRAGRAAAVFLLAGAGVVLWRVVARIAAGAPAAAGATASDAIVFLFLMLAAIFLSMVFVLMHAERAYATLHREASLDALTGALARGALHEQGERLLAAARRHQRPLSALLLDLDRFKAVNDRLGHDAGDALLRHLAARAKGVLRGEDVLCRLGGDEFVALLPQTDATGACVVAERLRQALAETPLSIRGVPIPVPISIGVATTVVGAGELDDLLRRADAAMYDAKHTGGDRVAIAAPG